MSLHPAVTLPFDKLYAGLMERAQKGYVKIHYDPDDMDLRLFCYTDKCVYEGAWDPFTRMARGLILHAGQKEIVAMPFPKFFNYGETPHNLEPDLPFSVTEKMDGSLIVVWYWNGKWRASTKGSFNSDQAQAAQAILDTKQNALQEWWWKDDTHLMELVGPSNRIVVDYTSDELVGLAVYGGSGYEFKREEVLDEFTQMGFRVADELDYNSLSEMVEAAQQLPKNREGFVVRYDNGYRLKIKGAEYRRIHSLLSKLTPLSVWEAMRAGDNLEAMRALLPEEYWSDFDDIVLRLNVEYGLLLNRISVAMDYYEQLSDAELGSQFEDHFSDIRGFVFDRRHNGRLTKRSVQTIYRMIRPKGNKLEGYTPSWAVNRFQEEAN